MKIEREFFLPHIAGNLGNSLEKAQELQIKLTEFSPIAKVASLCTLAPHCCLPVMCAVADKQPEKKNAVE